MYTSHRQAHNKARIAWLLLACFMLQPAIPLLAQVTSVQGDEAKVVICTYQGTKLLSLGGDEGDQQAETASSMQLCPGCLLHHLGFIALSGTEKPVSIAVLKKDSWLLATNSWIYDNSRITQIPIRAPPKT